MHGIEHPGVHFEAIAEFLRGSRSIAFREPVEPLVVEIVCAG